MRFAITTLTLLAVGIVSADDTTPTINSTAAYQYDGTTTYCYWIQQGLNATSFDPSKVKVEAKGNDCPLLVTISQITKGSMNTTLEYELVATLNPKGTKFEITPLTTLPDPITGQPVQIVHANIHTCSHSSVCDVFHDGTSRRISSQQTANFTNEKAQFMQTIGFAGPGEYNVVGHIVLPGKTSQETYHFVAFTTTNIRSNSSSTNAGDVGNTTAMVPAPNNSTSSPPKDKSTSMHVSALTAMGSAILLVLMAILY